MTFFFKSLVNGVVEPQSAIVAVTKPPKASVITKWDYGFERADADTALWVVVVVVVTRLPPHQIGLAQLRFCGVTMGVPGI